MGLQSIRVKTKRGFVMLAADAVHLFPHLDEARVFRPPTISAKFSKATRR
jgi:hypothetical protein